MRPETWRLSRIKESWKKDEGLVQTCYPLNSWIRVVVKANIDGSNKEIEHRFLRDIFNCEMTEEDLAKIPVPNVPHFGPKLYRHRMRRHYVLMPEGIGLAEIWKVISMIGGLKLTVDDLFLYMVRNGDGDRRKKESYIARFMNKGDDKDLMEGSVAEMLTNGKPTMRVSELLMAFLYNLCVVRFFPPTMKLGAVCPESCFSGFYNFSAYPCVSFDGGLYVVNGKAKPSRSLSYPPADAEVLRPELKIWMISDKNGLNAIFRPREVLVIK